MTDPISEFRSAMEAAGLGTQDPVHADGKLHRFQVDGDTRGKENGWYILHADDRPAGQFGTWKDPDTKHSWTAKVERRLSPAERQALEKRISDQRRIHEAEQARINAEAAERAEVIWAEAAPATQDHAYATRKGIRPLGARVSREALVIPLRDGAGKLWSLQFIQGNGDKRFLSGGRVAGCYVTIAQGRPDPDGVIAICEGYATGCSVHQATDWPVVVAFNAGNLGAVALTIRAKFPRARILIAGDNDQWTRGNPGEAAASAAARAVRGFYAFPTFPDAVAERKLTDWNDLATLKGLPEVAEQLEWPLTLGMQCRDPSDPPEPDTEDLSELFNPPAPIDPAGSRPAPELLPAELPTPSGPRFLYVISDWPIISPRGKPIACIENVSHLLRTNRIVVRYDVIRKDLHVIVPGESYLIDTQKNDQMTRIVSLAATAGLPVERVERFVAHIASQDPINPVADWILSKPWDGESRLGAFYNTVRSVSDADPKAKAFKETILMRWMVSAVAAAFRPDGVSAHGVLVFTGAQYIGKTNWFKRLVPPDLKVTRDGLLLDPKDKDSVYGAVSNWIVELGEIDATFKKADIAQLKAFLTKDQDTIRLPYERFPASFARRTVFFASVNDRDYLSDPTGNRRFWTIDCASLDHQHEIDMQQLWSEVYHLYREGETWYLSTDEMTLLSAHNKEFEVANPAEELIRSVYDWESLALYPTLARQVTTTEIALEIGYKTPSARELRWISAAMREIAKQTTHRTTGGRRVFNMPHLRHPIP